MRSVYYTTYECKVELRYVLYGMCNPSINFNPLDAKGNNSSIWNNTRLVHWPLMGRLLHLIQR